MSEIKKKYWIKYTLEKTPFEKKVIISWFDFLENRDNLLKGMIRSRLYHDIEFGEKILTNPNESFSGANKSVDQLDWSLPGAL